MTYKTFRARVDTTPPAVTLAMSRAEILEWIWSNDPDQEIIRAVLTAVQDPDDWKMPLLAHEPVFTNGRSASEWVRAAVVWFHAAEPLGTGELVASPGYQA